MNREASDTDLPVLPNEWWGPDSLPDEDSPYDGSHLLVSFNPPSNVMSVIVKNEEGLVEEVRLAFEFQSSEFEGLEGDFGSPIFVGDTESKIPLPPGMPPVTKLRLYVIKPIRNTTYQVIFIGCEEKGNLV